MTGELTLTTNYDTGQVILEGQPTGPAGGAILTPAPDIDLLFDRVSGHLCKVSAHLLHAGREGIGEIGVMRVLKRLFGASAARVIWNATPGYSGRVVSPQHGRAAPLSRLACFDATRATSPVPPSSPLWAAEGAVLAQRAGLLHRARAEARHAAAGLVRLLDGTPLPGAMSVLLSDVARLARQDAPEAARILRDWPAGWFSGSLRAWLGEFGSPSAGRAATRGRTAAARSPDECGPRWALDLTMLPAGLLLPALEPGDDLTVYLADEDNLRVQAQLAPSADDEALGRCRVRLVEASNRRVIAQAPLARDGARARATIAIPTEFRQADDLSSAWVEIVGDEDRPVRSETLRLRREALRWADSALRAERRPLGLAPHFSDGAWVAMAARGWEQCRRHWESTGDQRRADQAATYGRILASAAPATPGLPTSAAEINGLTPGEPAFLAEALGLMTDA